VIPKQQRDKFEVCLTAGSIVLRLAMGLVLALGALQAVQAQTIKVLYSFQGSTDGGFPESGLVQDSAGTLYGTTYTYGEHVAGVVFAVDTNGTENAVYAFRGSPDGKSPFDNVILAGHGEIYGTTYFGGSSGACGGGCGTVFKVDTSGNEKVLYSFAGGNSDGCRPYGGLIQDKSGNLYGMNSACGANDYGTVFKVSAKGKETVLHTFALSDGTAPYGGLVMDVKGNLYGDTQTGGSSGNGTVFKLSKAGKLTVLHNFAGGTTDGCEPSGTPILDKDENLYGTAYACGTSDAGMVWELSAKGKEKVLYNFSGTSDGGNPIAGVTMDKKGNLYGTAYVGGAANDGTVYELKKGKTFKLLFAFEGTDGIAPFGNVLLDRKGNLYGTAVEGGTDSTGCAYDAGCGTVWEITP
jgi:uncharacterized repeat protein (TIGR03803 family)